jgi:hypothetical protein
VLDDIATTFRDKVSAATINAFAKAEGQTNSKSQSGTGLSGSSGKKGKKPFTKKFAGNASVAGAGKVKQ